MAYVLSLIIGFLIGSIPSAYIIVKRELKIDITAVGSGNVGARNAYDISGSKKIGLVVLFLDLFKGILATFCGAYLIDNQFMSAVIAGIGSVLGHNYSPWLKFKGGRGLATAAGVMLLLCWYFVLTWLIIYFVLNSFLKNIHVSTVIATVLCFMLLFVIPDFILTSIIFPTIIRSEILFLGAIITILIISKHIVPLKEYFSKESNN
ncbi:MAG: glycerol-3-phosphate acyltransferase [Ignavibacteriales bacterium]|nr:glycerol-3-phosphate acyltransferase [Ignavibacteriales bacterium]